MRDAADVGVAMEPGIARRLASCEADHVAYDLAVIPALVAGAAAAAANNTTQDLMVAWLRRAGAGMS